MICYFEQVPSVILQSLHNLRPVRASLLQPIWPKFEEQFCVRVISQDTAGAAQRLQLISLNIHFDQINALARLEVIVQRYDIDIDGTAGNGPPGINTGVDALRRPDIKS